MRGGAVLCSLELHTLPMGSDLWARASRRVPSRLCDLLVWIVVFGSRYWIQVRILFACRGSDTRAPCSVLQCERTVEVFIHSPGAYVLRHCLSFLWAHGVCFVIHAMCSCLSCYPTPLVICTFFHCICPNDRLISVYCIQCRQDLLCSVIKPLETERQWAGPMGRRRLFADVLLWRRSLCTWLRPSDIPLHLGSKRAIF